MIKFSVLYPNREGKHFDLDYYCTRHITMCQKLVGDACRGVEVDAGIDAGAQAPYIVTSHFYFDSMESCQTAMEPHQEAMVNDIPNFTDIQPTIMLSEVKIKYGA